ncbi:MAG: DUF4388 domain-containing protein [Planctomycetota bacterium]
MTIKGNTKDIDLANMIQALSFAGREGVLRVWTVGRKIEIHITKSGIRLLCSDTAKHTLLGQLLIDSGVVTTQQLEQAVSKQKETSGRIGSVLVDLGFITKDEIVKCVKTQVQQELCDMFMWKSGTFEFEPLTESRANNYALDSELGIPLTFETEAILLEAARKADEWERLSQELETSSAVFCRAENIRSVPDLSPLGFAEKDATRILLFLENPAAVDEIVHCTSLKKAIACRLIAYLVLEGYVVEAAKEAAVHGELNSDVIGKAVGPEESSWQPKFMDTVFSILNDPVLENEIGKIASASQTINEVVSAVKELADSHAKTKSLDKAAALWQVVFRIEPTNEAVKKNLVSFFVSERRFSEAAKILVLAKQSQITSISNTFGLE